MVHTMHLPWPALFLHAIWTADDSLQWMNEWNPVLLGRREQQKSLHRPPEVCRCTTVWEFVLFFFLYCSISQTRSCYFCCHLKKPQLFSLSLPFSGRCPHSSSTSWFRFCRPVLTSMQKLNSCSQFSPHSHQITKLDKTLMHHTPLASLWRVKTERKSAVCDSL